MANSGKVDLLQTYSHVTRSRSPSPYAYSRSPSPRPKVVFQNTMSDYNIPEPLSAIGAQELLENQCTHCGWLRKKRTLKLFTWPQAYVVLQEGCLYYFKNEKARSAAGKFSLYGYNAVYRANEIPTKEQPWSLKIVHSHPEFKTYFFAASSEQEMKVWMSKIKAEMLQANGRSVTHRDKLQYVKQEELTEDEKFLDDPCFYQQIEENIYDDSMKFIPSNDYQKKCSVKKVNDDSDDEDLPDIRQVDNRRPAEVPTHDPFITIAKPIAPLRHEEMGHSLSTPLSSTQPAGPAKPPRVVAAPTPPQRPRPPMPTINPPPIPKSHSDTALINSVEPPIIQPRPLKNLTVKQLKTPPSKIKRKASYEKTEGPGSKSPVLPRRVPPVPQSYGTSKASGGGGSTGSDDMSEEEDWSDFYFKTQDKQKASDIIQNMGENGVFLVRPESTAGVSNSVNVLVVYAIDQCKKYRIKYENGEYFLAKEGYHDSSLENLLQYYKENNLPTVSIKLRTPFRQHRLYKHLNIDE